MRWPFAPCANVHASVGVRLAGDPAVRTRTLLKETICCAFDRHLEIVRSLALFLNVFLALYSQDDGNAEGDNRGNEQEQGPVCRKKFTHRTSFLIEVAMPRR